METRHDMMVFAFGIYLEEEEDLSFSTIKSYKDEAVKYYNGDLDEKPKYLDEAEKLIGFNS